MTLITNTKQRKECFFKMKLKLKVDAEIRDAMGNATPLKECHIDMELDKDRFEEEAINLAFENVTKIVRTSFGAK